MSHPKWIIKFIHKSKIHAVKIVTWEDHSEIATVPHVYTYNGEKSEGAKAAQLIASAPELLEALKKLVAADNCNYMVETMRYEGLFEQARQAIAKATE